MNDSWRWQLLQAVLGKLDKSAPRKIVIQQVVHFMNKYFGDKSSKYVRSLYIIYTHVTFK